MRKAIVCFALAIPVLALGAAAGDNYFTTLKGFEAAFRRGHAKSSLQQLELLVCWDQAMPQTRNDMYRNLAAGFSYVITRIDIERFVQATEHDTSPPQWSVKPTHELVVWYADDVDQPAFPIRYPIGKKSGQFKFAVMVKPSAYREWKLAAPRPKLAVPRPPTPVKPADNPYLQRFMSDTFKLVEETRGIDSDVFALLRSKIGSRSRFAERDQAFQLSDVPAPGDETLPDRRFVLAGHDDDIWFIKYIHGGFSPYGVLVIFSRVNQSWRIAFSAYGEPERSALGSTLDDIRRGIQLGYYFQGGDGGY
jgi:hypothetical protein